MVMDDTAEYSILARGLYLSP